MPKVVDHEQRRSDYLDALWRIVERDGAAAISVRSVAAEAGVSKTNVTYYFPSRIELLSAAADRLIAEAERRLATLDLSAPDLETVVKAWMISVPDSPARRRQSEIWLLLVAERHQNPRADEILAVLNRRVAEGMRRGLATLARAGLVHASRDLDLEASRLHALVDGMSLETMNDTRLMPTATMRAIFRAHLADLATPA